MLGEERKRGFLIQSAEKSVTNRDWLRKPTQPVIQSLKKKNHQEKSNFIELKRKDFEVSFDCPDGSIGGPVKRFSVDNQNKKTKKK